MKRIVLFADGTWNERDQVEKSTRKRRPTNVTKLLRAVVPLSVDSTGTPISQVVFYDEGVGTAGGLDKFTGGAFGSGIETNVRQLYRNLVYNYEVGDEIYLFGFSRGAFTVRTLLGFLNCVGLVENEDDYYVPDVYEWYQEGAKEGATRAKAFHGFHKAPRACPAITCVGVFDTVGALGAPGFLGRILNQTKYDYHRIELHPCIANAYHALAIDEQRAPFTPNIWRRPQDWSGQVKQVWFAGVHTNIGGGYPRDGLANIVLWWMVKQAERHGLALDRNYLLPFEGHFDAELYDSMTGKYRLLGRHVRSLGEHLSDGERIHRSVLERLGHATSKYGPSNLEFLKERVSALPIEEY